MDLYLIRHADALALGERGNTQDSERPLSDKGYGQSKQVGAWFQRKGIAPGFEMLQKRLQAVRDREVDARPGLRTWRLRLQVSEDPRRHARDKEQGAVRPGEARGSHPASL